MSIIKQIQEPIRWFSKLELKGKLFITTLLLLVIGLTALITTFAINRMQPAQQQAKTTVENGDFEEEFIKKYSDLINGNIRILEADFDRAKENNDPLILAKSYKLVYENSRQMIKDYDNLCYLYEGSYRYPREGCLKSNTPNKINFAKYLLDIGTFGDDEFSAEEQAARLKDTNILESKTSLNLKGILLKY